jgi:hypothetical protein
MITEQELKVLVSKAREKTKEKLVDSMTESACTQARDHIQRAVKEVCTDIISDAFKEELKVLLEGEKPKILEEARKSVNAIAEQFGKILFKHVQDQLDKSWNRTKLFETLLK